MLILQSLSYSHPNKDELFNNISLSVNKQEKVSLVGHNGAGKSTLLRLLAGELQPAAGQIHIDTRPYYIPQVFGQFNHLTVAAAMRANKKRDALNEILKGNATADNFTTLDDDWTIEERCQSALGEWQLYDIGLDQPLSMLSGGQKTKIFLAGLSVHRPDIILMDEPSNHLDADGRQLLYHFVQTTQATLLVVSHDRTLLNLTTTTLELGPKGIKVYGGNYDFYAVQKAEELQSLHNDIKDREKALRQAREKERENIERQQKLDARGKNKQTQAGTARIMMNTLRNNAEKSTSKMKEAHAGKVSGISEELQQLRATVPERDKMRLDFDNSALHTGKILFAGKSINQVYNGHLLWRQGLTLEITSGERLAIMGTNGSGKTTLIKMILGDMTPATGEVQRAINKAVYIDQDYSLINKDCSVYEQAQLFNTTGLQEFEVKIRLDRFLFKKSFWDKACNDLSGGERMRLMLCCLNIGNQAPDMIILDEPTNNLDIQNIEILTTAINEYRGTLVVISHDSRFVEELKIERFVALSSVRGSE